MIIVKRTLEFVRAHNKESNFFRYFFYYVAVSANIYETRIKIARADCKKFNQMICSKLGELSDNIRTNM